MNKTVIEMALEAGFEEIAFHKEGDSDFVCFTDEIEKFAELVRADEREQISTEERIKDDELLRRLREL